MFLSVSSDGGFPALLHRIEDITDGEDRLKCLLHDLSGLWRKLGDVCIQNAQIRRQLKQLSQADLSLSVDRIGTPGGNEESAAKNPRTNVLCLTYGQQRAFQRMIHCLRYDTFTMELLADAFCALGKGTEEDLIPNLSIDEAESMLHFFVYDLWPLGAEGAIDMVRLVTRVCVSRLGRGMLREETVASSFLTAFIRRCANEYIRTTLETPMTNLLLQQRALSDHPDQLKVLCSQLFSSICQSVAAVPATIKAIAYELNSAFPKTDGDDGVQPASDLLFLRFLANAVLLPERYGLALQFPISQLQRRNLQLVAKVLLKGAENGRFHVDGDSSTDVLNEFLDSRGGDLRSFIQQVAEAGASILWTSDRPETALLIPSTNDDEAGDNPPDLQPAVMMPRDLYNVQLLLQRALDRRRQPQSQHMSRTPPKNSPKLKGMAGPSEASPSTTITQVVASLRSIPDKAEPGDTEYMFIDTGLPFASDLPHSPIANLWQSETGETPRKNQKVDNDSTVVQVTKMVVRALSSLQPFVSDIVVEGSCIQSLEQMAARALSQGDQSLCTRLRATAAALNTLPPSYHKADFRPFFQHILKTINKNQVEYERQLDQRMHPLLKLRLLLEKHHKRVERELQNLQSATDRCYLRPILQRLEPSIGNVCQKLWSNTRTGKCSGATDVNNDRFSCPVCEKSLQQSRKIVEPFLRVCEEPLQRSQRWSQNSGKELQRGRVLLHRHILSAAHDSAYRSCAVDDVYRQHLLRLSQSVSDYKDLYILISKGEKCKLDIDEGLLTPAFEELSRIDSFHSSKEKLDCLLRVRQIVWDTLSLMTSPSADDYVPLICMILLRCCPRHLLSDIQYIQSFIHLADEEEKPFLDVCVAVKCLIRLCSEANASQRRKTEEAIAERRQSEESSKKEYAPPPSSALPHPPSMVIRRERSATAGEALSINRDQDEHARGGAPPGRIKSPPPSYESSKRDRSVTEGGSPAGVGRTVELGNQSPPHRPRTQSSSKSPPGIRPVEGRWKIPPMAAAERAFAAAANKFGNTEKKNLIESMMELGYRKSVCKLAVASLTKDELTSPHGVTKALDFLVRLGALMDMGFSEEAISKSLHTHGFDLAATIQDLTGGSPGFGCSGSVVIPK